MGKKILIGCPSVPGFGGAGTSAYSLFKTMQAEGRDVAYLNLMDERHEPSYRSSFGDRRGNPEGLENVYRCTIRRPLSAPQPEIGKRLIAVKPDVILAVSQLAAYLLKQARPDLRVIFLSTGCEQVKQHIHPLRSRNAATLVRRLEKNTRAPHVFHEREAESIRMADGVLVNADVVRFLFKKFFPLEAERFHHDVIWFAEWIHRDAASHSDLQRPFAERDIDVLFVASSWRRREKNFRFVEKIAAAFRNASIHIVGETSRPVRNATPHGLLAPGKDIFELFGRAKTVACPSLWDAAPGILFEASALGCNIVASKNCGNWEICNQALLVDPFNVPNFVSKIALSLTQKFEDNVEAFLRLNSYDALMEVLEA